MELELWRYSSDVDSTLGFLMVRRGTGWELLCFTVEDQFRATKVSGETRIPAGLYQLNLRTDSPMARRYASDIPGHKGMVWLQNVPGFEFVYLHIGNDEDDTEGCILIGEGRNEISRSIGRSRSAYLRIYPKIADAITEGGGASLIVRDLDRAPHP